MVIFPDDALLARLRNLAGSSEAMQILHPELLDIIYREGWFRLFIPQKSGGLELTLPEAVRLEEQLSKAEGSLGWTVTLCAGAGWFAGFVAASVRDEFFTGKEVCFAGSGAATGTAEITDSGYRINGAWKYATGALHATAFTANCVLQKDGAVLLDDTGAPVVRPFLLKREEVTIEKSWSSMGLVATGSHTFRVEHTVVPETRCFRIDAVHATLSDAVYQYPFLPLAEATLAVNSLGMCLHFLDLCGDIFSAKTSRVSAGQAAFRNDERLRAKEAVAACRTSFYHALDASWKSVAAGKRLSVADLERISAVSRKLARESRQAVDTLYPYCGLTAAQTGTEINRVWRDMHTASQHALLVF